MAEKKARSAESGRFEASLRRLLQTAYQPPEARGEFKAELLNKLKTRQARLARTRRRQRRRRLALASAVKSLIKVDLPVPLCPTTETNSLGLICKLISLTAVVLGG